MEKTNQHTLVLEPSSNTHLMSSNEEIKQNSVNGYPEMLILEVKGEKGIVTHGEHATVVTEHRHVIKTVQQEYNPILKKIQVAFD